MKITKPTDCPYYLVSRLTLALTAELKKEFIDAGIGQVKPAYLGVLMSLWNEEGIKVADLGSRAGLEPSTMTGLLDRMEREGLVERSPSLTDRRVLNITLTAEGRSIRGKVLGVIDRVLTRVFSVVSDRELEQTKKTLYSVLNVMSG